MTTNQPTEREVRDLLAGTLAAEAFDQKYGAGAANKVIELNNTPDQTTAETTAQEDNEKRGLIADTAVGIAEGVREGFESFGEGAFELGNTLREKGIPIPVFDVKNKQFIFDNDEIAKLREERGGSIGEKVFKKADDIMPDPERWTGGLAQGVTQFGMGFVTGKKLVTGLTYGVKAIPAVNTARNITAAAFADGAFFNSYEARLSDLINEHAPWASNSLTEYLASDPEDTFWEGRFKNVIEGGAIGGLAETIFLMARVGKRVHDAKQKKNLDKLLNEEQFVKDTERLEELVTDLDSSIKEAADEKLAQTKELKTNVTSTADNIPVKETETELPPRDESSGMAADGVPAQYGPPIHDLNAKIDEEFTPAGYSTYSTDVGANYERINQFKTGNPAGDAELRAIAKEETDFVNKLKEIKGNPEATVTVYRAAPVQELREGDLITPSRTEAQYYVNESKITRQDIRDAETQRRLDTDEPVNLQTERNNRTMDRIVDLMMPEVPVTPSKVFSYELKAKDIRWDGNNGFVRLGYFPTKEFPSNNVKDIPDPLQQKRIDDRVISEAESKSTPLTREQVDDIAKQAKDEYLGLGEKTAELVLRQVEDVKAGKSKELDLDTGINVKNLTGTDRDAIVFDIVTERLKRNNQKLKAVERQVVVKNAADILARNPSEVLVRIDKLAKEVNNSTETLMAAISVAQTYANAIPRIARQIEFQKRPEYQKFITKQDARVAEAKSISLEEARKTRVEWNEEDLRNVISFLGKIILDEKFVEKQFGRGIAIRKAKTDPADVSITQIRADLARFDGNFDKFMTKASMLDQDAKGFMKLLRYVFKNRGWDLANEVWINMLLSSPKTHVVNTTSNAIMTLVRPAENYYYGVITGNKRMRKEAINTVAGLFHGYRDLLQYLKKSWQNEDGVLDAGIGKVEGVEKVTNLAFGKRGGGFVRAATRLLTLEDEFFKQINYRGKLYANVVQRADDLKLSKKKNPETGISEYEEFVEAEFEKGFDPETGLAQNDEALDYARELTFTSDLNPNSFSGRIQQTVNDNPALRQILPFIRTPVNIATSAIDRSPLALLRSEVRDKLFANFRDNPTLTIKEVREARAKFAMGNTFLGAAGALAAFGLITGGGPQNNDDRIRLRKSGWQPYSLKVGDTYYPYGRIEPLAMIFGTVADVSEMHADLLPEDQLKITEALQLSFWSTLVTTGTGLTMQGVAKNLASKTYLKTMSDVLLALFDQDGYRMERFINSAISSRILPSFVRNLNEDPYWRETRTMIDRVRNTMPYFSQKYGEVRYDFLGEKDKRVGTTLGRLINPFMTTSETNDIVYDALNELNYTVKPPSEVKNGIQLAEFVMPDGKNAYERYNELIGKQTLDDMTMRQALEAYITSDDYKDATMPYRFDERNFYKGGRISEIDRIVADYREEAFYELLDEMPKSKDNEELDLESAIFNNKDNKADWNENYKNNISDLFKIK